MRTTLLPGILKTLHSNQKNELPHKLFEVADVCLIDDTTDTGARNQRRACVLYSEKKTSGLDLIHGVLDHIMKKFGIPQNAETGYSIRASSVPTFFGQMQAEVILEGQPPTPNTPNTISKIKSTTTSTHNTSIQTTISH